jgi:hypothetical protein
MDGDRNAPDVGDLPIAQVAVAAPVTPSPEARAEIEAFLDADRSALGDVWRRTRAGESPEEIQAARGTQRTSFVWSYRRMCTALVEGNLPTAPTVAIQVARKFRSILNDGALSEPTQRYLRQNLVILEQRAESEVLREVEDTVALEATEEAEAEAVPGVYVYALPHYLRYPYDAESNRTLLKVGRSDRSVIRRFREQIRTTALPEEPVLLRIYVTLGEDASHRERQFHDLLEAADHDRSRARTGGTEWFLTSLKFLDVVADTLGLEARRVNDPGAVD